MKRPRRYRCYFCEVSFSGLTAFKRHRCEALIMIEHLLKRRRKK